MADVLRLFTIRREPDPTRLKGKFISSSSANIVNIGQGEGRAE
jgi:hypothetical protein